MVQTVSELFEVVRANPTIDGLGYFIEVQTESAFDEADVREWTDFMKQHFCDHANAASDGDCVLGLDFHEHLLRSEDPIYLEAVEELLLEIEARFGISHLCVEFQFDFAAAKKNQTFVDDLLQP